MGLQEARAIAAHNIAIARSKGIAIPTKPRRCPAAYHPFGLEAELFKMLRVSARQLFNSIYEATKGLDTLVTKVQAKHPVVIKTDAQRLDGFTDDLKSLMSPLYKKWGAKAAELQPDVEKLITKVADKNFMQVQGQLKAVIGVDVVQHEPWLKNELKASSHEMASLIKNIGQKAIGDVERIVSDGVRLGHSTKSIKNSIVEQLGVTERRAALIAVDQVGKLNGNLNRLRQTALGIEEYDWATCGDSRVRQAHKARQGVRFSWKDAPADGHPGYAVRCRCIAQPVIDMFSDLLGNMPPSAVKKAAAGLVDEEPVVVKGAGIKAPGFSIEHNASHAKLSELANNSFGGKTLGQIETMSSSERLNFVDDMKSAEEKAYKAAKAEYDELKKASPDFTYVEPRPEKATKSSSKDLKEFSTTEEFHAWAKTQYNANELTSAERAGLKEYQSGDYQTINSFLRGRGVGNQSAETVADYFKSKGFDKTVKQIDSALKEGAASESFVTFRGVRSKEAVDGLRAAIGGIYKDPAFMSTTPELRIAKKMASEGAEVGETAVMRIVVPAGTPSFFLNEIKDIGENEVLLGRNLELRIIKSEIIKGLEYFDCEVVEANAEKKAFAAEAKAAKLAEEAKAAEALKATLSADKAVAAAALAAADAAAIKELLDAARSANNFDANYDKAPEDAVAELNALYATAVAAANASANAAESAIAAAAVGDGPALAAATSAALATSGKAEAALEAAQAITWNGKKLKSFTSTADFDAWSRDKYGKKHLSSVQVKSIRDFEANANSINAALRGEVDSAGTPASVNALKYADDIKRIDASAKYGKIVGEGVVVYANVDADLSKLVGSTYKEEGYTHASGVSTGHSVELHVPVGTSAYSLSEATGKHGAGLLLGRGLSWDVSETLLSNGTKRYVLKLTAEVEAPIDNMVAEAKKAAELAATKAADMKLILESAAKVQKAIDDAEATAAGGNTRQKTAAQHELNAIKAEHAELSAKAAAELAAKQQADFLKLLAEQAAATAKLQTASTVIIDFKNSKAAVDTWAADKYDASKLTNAAKIAITKYQQPADYKAINSGLRGNNNLGLDVKGNKTSGLSATPAELVAHHAETIKQLDKALDAHKNTETFRTYRGFHGQDIVDKFKAAVGGEVVDKGYVSTSPLSDIMKKYSASGGGAKATMEIIVPPGTPTYYLNAAGPVVAHDAEILLGRDLQYKVISCTTTNGIDHFVCEVVPPGNRLPKAISDYTSSIKAPVAPTPVVTPTPMHTVTPTNVATPGVSQFTKFGEYMKATPQQQAAYFNSLGTDDKKAIQALENQLSYGGPKMEKILKNQNMPGAVLSSKQTLINELAAHGHTLSSYLNLPIDEQFKIEKKLTQASLFQAGQEQKAFVKPTAAPTSTVTVATSSNHAFIPFDAAKKKIGQTGVTFGEFAKMTSGEQINVKMKIGPGALGKLTDLENQYLKGMPAAPKPAVVTPVKAIPTFGPQSLKLPDIVKLSYAEKNAYYKLLTPAEKTQIADLKAAFNKANTPVASTPIKTAQAKPAMTTGPAVPADTLHLTSGSQLTAWAKGKYETRAQMKPSEFAGIHAYQGQSYMSINGALRGGHASSATDATHIKHLTTLLKKNALKENVMMYRGVKGSALLQEFKDALGGEWTDKGYGSTTAERNVAHGYSGATPGRSSIIEVVMPKGTPSYHMNTLGKDSKYINEQEVLLDRNNTFRVTHHFIDHNGIDNFRFEVVPK